MKYKSVDFDDFYIEIARSIASYEPCIDNIKFDMQKDGLFYKICSEVKGIQFNDKTRLKLSRYYFKSENLQQAVKACLTKDNQKESNLECVASNSNLPIF